LQSTPYIDSLNFLFTFLNMNLIFFKVDNSCTIFSILQTYAYLVYFWF
jgi:hypothetical protein